MTNINSFNDLYKIIRERIKKQPKGSYVMSLVKVGKNRISQKVGEEAVELIIEAVKDKTNRKALISEASDLFFHLWVLLAYLNITPSEILDELKKRHQTKNKRTLWKFKH